MDSRHIIESYERTVRDIGWLKARSYPPRKRLAHFPLKTLAYGASDKLRKLLLRKTGAQLLPMKTFWGARLVMLYPNYRSVLHHGIIDGHELPFEDYFVRTIKPGDVFFDIGANVGFYSLLARDMGAAVHAFEPTPSTFAVLAKNVSDVTLVNKAMSDSGGKIPFLDMGIANGTNTIMIKDKDAPTIQIESTTLDEYCESSGVRPTMLKIDTEGADMKIIRGGMKTLRKYRPTLVFETIDPDLIELVCSLGYSMKDIGDEGPSKFKCRVFSASGHAEK